MESNSNTGRDIVIYTHNSLEKLTVQIKMENEFAKACILETRLRGGDTLLFGCIYRSPTVTQVSAMNTENFNHLLKTICNKHTVLSVELFISILKISVGKLGLFSMAKKAKKQNFQKRPGTASFFNILKRQPIFTKMTTHL